MRQLKTALIIALFITALLPLSITRKVQASSGEAKVYIINLAGVPSWWVDNKSRVADGAIDACMLNGTFIQDNVPRAHPRRNVDYPPYYDATPCIVTDWGLYHEIITGYNGVIVVNTHGEYLPIPHLYTKEQWVDEIAEAMLNRRLTWVHVAGYTFYKVYYAQTQTSEDWGEQGFKHFMNHINKGNINLWPDPYSENETATNVFVEKRTQISNWYDRTGHQVTSYSEANLGRPLKFEDFKEYLLMPIFKYKDRWAGAAVVFAKAGARYVSEHGCGAYVHMGMRYLYGSGWTPDSDYGKGFIGTAIALWFESMGFEPKHVSGEWYGNHRAFFKVHPIISGTWIEDDFCRHINLKFVICGVMQYPIASLEDPWFSQNGFVIFDLPPPWNNVQMKVDMEYSREEDEEGLQLLGLYDESQKFYGLLSSSILWFASVLLYQRIQLLRGSFGVLEGSCCSEDGASTGILVIGHLWALTIGLSTLNSTITR